MPSPIATRCIKVSRPTWSFCMEPRSGNRLVSRSQSARSYSDYANRFLAKIRPFDLLPFT
jgi:hypothetical protein